MELEEIKRLLAVDPAKILAKTVDPLGTELDVVKSELKAMSYLRISNRLIEIPGITRNMDMVIATVAEFRDLKKRNILPLQFAKSDDIVVMPIRLEHNGGTNHTGENVQVQQTLTLASTKYTGIFGIIPQWAIDATPTLFEVQTDQMFIITDIIELYSPPGLTGVRIRDVDGVPQYALDGTLATKASDLQIFELPHPIIANSTFAIDGKIESETAADTVTTAPWVVGVWVGFGKDVPALARPGT